MEQPFRGQPQTEPLLHRRLDEFAAGKRSIIFQAVEGTVADQLRDLTEAILICQDDPVLRAAPLPNWDAALAYLAREGCFSPPRVDHVIIPEPLDVDRVCIGHRGVWWAEIETQGRIAHGSMPFLGDCAIRHMAAVIDALERDLWPRLARRSSSEGDD